ncbi:MAG: hypothetical protein FJ313_04305, partial [Gemmatimonadetes bacterium]|nr:hypothetical protein [Gemmatimonadota bacterium]
MRTQYLLACSLLTIIPGLCPSAQAAPNDHLDAIIRGPAFGELGKHGQAVALYLAAIQAPSWAESERLLQRIWDEYPGSAPVDVAHAFAGRHYRDAGDKTQAIAHFEQALRAARGRARPWTALLQGELSALGERVAQAPGPPGGAPAADEWVEVTPDSGLGEWTSVPPVQTLVTPLPEERAWSFEASIPDPQTWAFPASLHLTGPLVVVAASFRVKAPPDVAFSVQFVDADGTTVIARSRGVQPDEDGWRSFAIDFARQGLNQISIVGIRTADAVMGPLDCIQLVLEPPIPLGAPPLEIVVSDLKLRLGDPVRGSAGPQIVTDDAGWRWLSSTCQVRLDDTVIREGVPSVRVSAEVGPSAPQDARKSVVALPPVEGSPWLGDRLVFWCLPRTTPYLEVCIVSGKPDAIDTSEGSTLKGGGMGLVKVLDADDLTVGEWNHVEIAFADIRTRFNMEDTFGEIDTVSFSPGSREQGGREAFSKPGEYVWYISGLHVEGQGPVIFRRPGPAIRDVGLDATWFA